MTSFRFLAIAAVCLTIGSAGSAQQKSPEAIAVEVITEMAARQFDKVAARSAEPFATLAPVARLVRSWDASTARCGAYRRVIVRGVEDAPVTASAPKGTRLVLLTVEFERASLDDSNIKINLQGQIVGLHFGEKPKPGEAGDLDKTKTVLTSMIEKALKEQGIPSLSIALVKGDSVVWKAAFGHANVRTKTPATPDTLYSTGSTFKSATATALMQLVEQGKLALDQPVNRYLDEDKIQDRLQSEKPVTIAHILSHWSGLVGGANIKPIWGRQLPKTLDKMITGLYSIRAPETTWEYNNFGYGLAGFLVEKISGTEYEKYMLENVLQPIGITTPHPVYPSPEMVELMALPYLPGGPTGPPKPVAQVHYDVYPAGDVYLTAEDMARFLGAHLNGGVFNGRRILTDASVKKAHEPQFGAPYGFGWSVKQEASGHTIIFHSGGIPGQSSQMMGDVEARVGVYYMTNSSAPIPELADAAVTLLRGEEYVPLADRKTITVDPNLLDTYVGTYQVAGGNVLNVSRDGGSLFIQPNTRSKIPLAAETPVMFRGPAVAITFARNEAGVVDHIIVAFGNGPLTVARRGK